MAKPELGMKRACLSCGTKFYDLNKNPIICPKCGAPFLLAATARPREVAADDDETELPSAAAPELVPLEAVVADEAGKTDIPDDIEIEDTEIAGEDDDTFLEPEEDEDEGDVTDLIDGDLEEDEES